MIGLYTVLKHINPAVTMENHNIGWLDGKQVIIEWDVVKLGPQPTQEEIDAAMMRIMTQESAIAHKAKRAAEYPPMTDYLDAQVKKASADATVRLAGIAQEQAYAAACTDVKAKYPKS